MKSSIPPRALQIAPGAVHSAECSAINDRVPGMAACSLPFAPHSTHRLLCEGTGETLGEWTDADPTFREPTNEIQRRIEFSDRPIREIDYVDVA